jgi:hypothetical protein
VPSSRSKPELELFKKSYETTATAEAPCNASRLEPANQPAAADIPGRQSPVQSRTGTWPSMASWRLLKRK